MLTYLVFTLLHSIHVYLVTIEPRTFASDVELNSHLWGILVSHNRVKPEEAFVSVSYAPVTITPLGNTVPEVSYCGSITTWDVERARSQQIES